MSLAQRIVPAADLSEQISTAGKEASGTGNMKLALNGALTIGTLDGANVEINEEVGEENIFIFGLTVEEVHALCEERLQSAGLLHEKRGIARRRGLGGIELLHARRTARRPEHAPRQSLSTATRSSACADFESYSECQKKVDAAFRQKSRWAKMAILNTARMGKFSSDRAIAEYARDIWKIEPIHI